jgi:hypothetical protein
MHENLKIFRGLHPRTPAAARIPQPKILATSLPDSPRLMSLTPSHVLPHVVDEPKVVEGMLVIHDND